MRERLDKETEERKNDGITPAYAGKTREIDARVDTNRDHPRVCGKDSIFKMTYFII